MFVAILIVCIISYLIWKKCFSSPEVEYSEPKFSYLSERVEEERVEEERVEQNLKIKVITDHYACQRACIELKRDCTQLSALGLDCEWVSRFDYVGPVALLQLASINGLCCLFRLNLLKTIPKELAEILKDDTIIKLGVNVLNDARRLKESYDVQPQSTLDLRFLYPDISGGLNGLSQTILGIKLKKEFDLQLSNWEALQLKDTQKYYAAMDAYVAIKIFQVWLFENNIRPNRDFSSCFDVKQFLNRHYAKNQNYRSLPSTPDVIQVKPDKFFSGHQIRKKPLYHNCFMHAPDGELLCSCDKKKAEWYIERGLAEVFSNEPFSIKLLFEPAARANEKNEGRFYQQLKQNCCVVCGINDSYLRYNVVPREYRKHFPKIMKDHQSHDIVLLCIFCHQVASNHTKILKEELAKLCNAPFKSSKVKGSEIHHKIKNYGKALLKSNQNIPADRKTIMENEIKQFFNVTELTINILHNASSLNINTNNECSTHGLKVTNYFSQQKGGLMELEILWRKHFLTTMKPKYLPALWSISHNHSRL